VLYFRGLMPEPSDRRRAGRRVSDRPNRKATLRERFDRHAAISVLAFLLLLSFLFLIGAERSPRVVIEKALEAIAAATVDLIFGLMRGA
jgi:hypothetical protein